MAAALVGLGNALFMALNNGLIQTAVRPEMRGRVMSMVMLIWGGMPLGVLPLSVFAEAFGIAYALSLSALGLLLVLLWARWRLPSLREEARSGSRADARAGAPQSKQQALPPARPPSPYLVALPERQKQRP